MSNEFDHLSREALIQHCRIMDNDNSNLRRHLAWAAQFLKHNERMTLKKRIEDAWDDNTYLIETQEEQDRAFFHEFQKDLEQVVDHMTTLAETHPDDAEWGPRFRRLDDKITKLAGYLASEDPPEGIHEVRYYSHKEAKKRPPKLKGRKLDI